MLQALRKFRELEAHGEPGTHGSGGHVMPMPILAGVWIALVILTVVTVAVTWINLGAFSLWVAMAIATVKATLVVLYFMHLRYDRPFNLAIFITALLFASLFVGIALTDTKEYQPDLIPGYAPAMDQQQTTTGK
jgi:cytochrome c oxidase subunit 4